MARNSTRKRKFKNPEAVETLLETIIANRATRREFWENPAKVADKYGMADDDIKMIVSLIESFKQEPFNRASEIIFGELEKNLPQGYHIEAKTRPREILEKKVGA